MVNKQKVQSDDNAAADKAVFLADHTKNKIGMGFGDINHPIAEAFAGYKT